jgi:hypothetical protein
MVYRGVVVTCSAAILTLVGCGGAQSNARTPLDVPDLLWLDADSILKNRHAIVDESVRRHLVSMIEEGARRLNDSRPDQLTIARQNVRTLVDAMVDHAQENEPPSAKGIVEVVERDFEAVRNRVCPVFPFC